MNFMRSALVFLLCIGTGTKDLWLFDSIIVVPALRQFLPSPLTTGR